MGGAPQGKTAYPPQPGYPGAPGPNPYQQGYQPYPGQPAYPAQPGYQQGYQPGYQAPPMTTQHHSVTVVVRIKATLSLRLVRIHVKCILVILIVL